MTERLTPELMALRASAELNEGEVVNLGIGLPTLVANYITQQRGVILHSENGLLGFGPHADQNTKDIDLINARAEFVTLLPGSSVINHAEAFGIARSGRLNVAILGGLQVSEKGDLANWWIPDRGIGSPGGALDFASFAKRLIVIMRHTLTNGSPKILNECTYPLTVAQKVHVIVTDLGVIEVKKEGLQLKELAPGWDFDSVQDLTEPRLLAAPDLKEMDFILPNDSTLSKIYPTSSSAVADVFDGATILMDGFGGLGGMSHYLMMALRDQGAKNLTIVGNTAGIARVSSFGTTPVPGWQVVDHSILVENGQIKKAIASFPVSPSPSRPTAFEEAYRRGEVEMELAPQGTLAERIRAGGFGIAAFYTTTGAKTLVSDGKESRVINGKEHILETAIRGDFAFIRAHKADRLGNLVYRGTSRNFNATMARAGNVTIAEVDEIVEPGELDPDEIVTPGVYVDRIVKRPTGFVPFERVE